MDCFFTCVFGYLAHASLLTQPVLTELLFESNYSKLIVNDGGGWVNYCE